MRLNSQLEKIGSPPLIKFHKKELKTTFAKATEAHGKLYSSQW